MYVIIMVKCKTNSGEEENARSEERILHGLMVVNLTLSPNCQTRYN